jgi:WD40 repeat protein
VEGALARRANAIYGAMSPDRQAIARRVLLRLTQPGEGTEDTRRRAELRELVTRPEETGEVDAVVAALAEGRLLATGRDEATGRPVVEVTHEALIRGWPELRGWIGEDREQLRQHRRLSDATAEWEVSGRDEGQLYGGARLALWQERERSDLNEQERAFLAESEGRAERERRSRRRRAQILVGGLAAVAAIVAGLAILALLSRQDAADQRDTALSRQLAGSSTLARQRDPELAVLLAESAYRSSQTLESEEALRQAVHESRIRGALRLPAEVPTTVAHAADGRVVVGSESGLLRLWDPVQDPRGASPVVLGRWEGGISGLVGTPGGYLTGGADGELVLWPARGAPVGPTPIVTVPGAINRLEASGDGRRVLIAGDRGVWLVDVAARRAERVASGAFYDAAFDDASGGYLTAGVGGLQRWGRGPGGPEALPFPATALAQNVAVSPDGRLLAVGGSDGLHLLRLGARPTTLVSRALDGGVNGVSFAAAGRLGVAGGDGRVLVYDRDGRPLARMIGHDGAVGGVSFAGSDLVSVGNDGSARSWDWSAGVDPELRGRTLASSGGAAFGPDGEVTIVEGDGSTAVWTPGRADVRTILPPVSSGDAYAAAVERGIVAEGLLSQRVVVRDAAGATLASVPTDRIPIAVAIDPERRRAGVGLDGGGIVTFDLEPDATPTSVGRHESATLAVAFSPADATLASAGRDGIVKAWDGAGGSRSLGRHDGQVLGLALSADGRRLASAGGDKTVRVWDLSGREPARVLRGHRDQVLSVVFTDDGRLVSGGYDAMRIWDWRRGVTLLSVPGAAVQVDADGDAPRVAHYGLDNVVRVTACDVCGPIDSVLRLAQDRTTRELSDTERADFHVDR